MIARALIAGFGLLVVVGIASAPAIERWERANGYPFGKACNSVFSGFVDTCPEERPLCQAEAVVRQNLKAADDYLHEFTPDHMTGLIVLNNWPVSHHDGGLVLEEGGYRATVYWRDGDQLCSLSSMVTLLPADDY